MFLKGLSAHALGNMIPLKGLPIRNFKGYCSPTLITWTFAMLVINYQFMPNRWTNLPSYV